MANEAKQPIITNLSKFLTKV